MVEYELRRLGDDWKPWKWQIVRRDPGDHWAVTSTINYEHYEDALQYFMKLVDH